ncbi:hypothetical protein [Schinkia azotoformans]|uniref:hypothetical protein n=1 Tax=Schinkia azotoformans TaxID=1454 RepID=UPI002DBB4A08|nr:hypothetical protein [Schinkia azotoformans]MEC1760383.1 hypothetical protein [Schinkia azotoformans]
MRLILVLLFLISLTSIILIKFVFGDIPEKIKLGEEIGEVIFNLSIGYISSFIFYILDIWIPEIKTKKKLNDRISIPMSRLMNRMFEPIKDIAETYDGGKSLADLSDKELGEIVQRVDLINDKGPVYLVNLNTNATYGEYLYLQIEEANQFVEQIYKIPFNFNIEIIDILDRIQNSKYHEIMRSIKKYSGFRGNNVQLKGEVIAETIIEYYRLFKELKDYMNKHKIKITIKELE